MRIPKAPNDIWNGELVAMRAVAENADADKFVFNGFQLSNYYKRF